MKFPKYALLAALVYGFSTLPAVAGVYAEADVAGTADAPNTINDVTNADGTTTDGAAKHPLQVDGSTIEVDGILSAMDVDVYALDVQDTDNLTFEIQCGFDCSFLPNGGLVDTRLTIVDGADMSILANNDDQSASNYDPLITNFTLNKTGRIYILVTQTGSTIDDPLGSVTYNGEWGTGYGDYKLMITGATAPAASDPVPTTSDPVPTTDTGDQIVNIRVNPYFRGKWPRINPRSRGLLPVALLSDSSFVPMNVIKSTLRFGLTGEEDTLVRCQRIGRDLNRDGVEDLLCFFSMRNAGFDPYSENAVLTGSVQNSDGSVTDFTAQAPLKMVPYKRRHNNGRSIFGRSHRR